MANFRDRLNQEINVDNIVVTYHPKFKEIIVGKVIGFTPQKVRIEAKIHGYKRPKEFLRDSVALVVIESDLAMLYYMKNVDNF